MDISPNSERNFISCILNDPQPLPDIFKFLSWTDFEDAESAWIFHSFYRVYSGMALDTNVWLKRTFDIFCTDTDTNSTEARIKWRGMADDIVLGTHPITLARHIRKESLHRHMIKACEEYARFDIFRQWPQA